MMSKELFDEISKLPREEFYEYFSLFNEASRNIRNQIQYSLNKGKKKGWVYDEYHLTSGKARLDMLEKIITSLEEYYQTQGYKQLKWKYSKKSFCSLFSGNYKAKIYFKLK